MQSLGVSLHTPPISGEPTGTCVILITPDAERTMNTHLGASATFQVEHVTEDALKQAEWLYLEGYLFSTDGGRAAVRRAIDLAKKHQVKISLTFSDRFIVEVFGDALRAAVADCHLIFANEQEASAYVGTAQDIFSHFQKSAPNVIMTRSEKGVLGTFGGSSFQTDAFPIQAVDATGAGDMFAGAFLYGITHDQTAEDAARLACFLSSKVVSQLGPRLQGDVKELVQNM
jgi:sugar/nucleoside kinase (ribokinase family)